MTDKSPIGPGESKTRARRRRYIIYMVIAALLGGTIGAILNIGEGSASDLFAGDLPRSINPAIAIGAAILLLFGFVAMPVWGFTQIDEHMREQNYIGFTGGAISVLAGYPIWVVLAAGGFLSPPTALQTFLLALVGMSVTFIAVKLIARFG